MIEPLLALPEHVQERLSGALRAGLLAPPYTPTAVAGALGQPRGVDVELLTTALAQIDSSGVSPTGVSLALEAAAHAQSRVRRPELVWSGPEVAGLHARDTARVFDELVAGAEGSLWISTYVYYDGPKAFATLAQRMDAVPRLAVTLLLNVGNGAAGPAEPDPVIAFARRLWDREWPGARRPDVFYDPRALEPGRGSAVLHAKAVVADERVALVTSANLTERAFESNIEAGILTHDQALSRSIVLHFRTLIEKKLLLSLPD